MSLNTTRELFARHGLRCTRQRELLFEALAGTTAHPTADELYRMVVSQQGGTTVEGASGPESELSLATVYNTLEIFTERGLCRRLPCPRGGGPCRYDADMSEHVHVALIDGRVIDLPDDLSRKLIGNIPRSVLAEIERRIGIRVSAVSVQVFEKPGND